MLHESSAALELTEILHNKQQRIVFAESCTAGAMAAIISRTAGVSEIFCGSMVTYRNNTKSNWLGVDSVVLEDPEIGPVSEIVAREMAHGVLENTPEADLSVSVTGHLGPGAPAEQDGLVFVGIQKRGQSLENAEVVSWRLPVEYPDCSDELTLRLCRQSDLVERIFKHVVKQYA